MRELLLQNLFLKIYDSINNIFNLLCLKNTDYLRKLELKRRYIQFGELSVCRYHGSKYTGNRFLLMNILK